METECEEYVVVVVVVIVVVVVVVVFARMEEEEESFIQGCLRVCVCVRVRTVRIDFSKDAYANAYAMQ